MPRTSNQPQPTEAELAILLVLWDAGPCTVRDVHETLKRTRESSTGYTTVLKLMQIMAKKGLVERDESRRSHVYRAVDSQESTQQGLVAGLIDKAFSGSTSQLVLRALSAKKVDQEELAKIREILARAEAES